MFNYNPESVNKSKELPIYSGDTWSQRYSKVGGAHPTIMNTEYSAPIDVFSLSEDQLTSIKDYDDQDYSMVKMLQDSGLRKIDDWWGLQAQEKKSIILNWGMTMPDSFLDKIAFKVGLMKEHQWLDYTFIKKVAEVSHRNRYRLTHPEEKELSVDIPSEIYGVNDFDEDGDIDEFPDLKILFETKIKPELEQIAEKTATEVMEGHQYAQELESLLNIFALNVDNDEDALHVEREVFSKYVPEIDTYYTFYMHMSGLYIDGHRFDKVKKEVRDRFLKKQSENFHQKFLEIIRNEVRKFT